MGTLTKGLIALEDQQGGQGTFTRKTSTGGTQTLTKRGEQSRIINILDYVNLTDADHTSGFNEALLAASPNDGTGTAKETANIAAGNADGPISTNEAWAYAGYVYVPAGCYWVTNLLMPHGVRMIGAGMGGFGLKGGQAATRLCQLEAAASTDLIQFIDRAGDGNVSFFEIAHMTMIGQRDGDADGGSHTATAGSAIHLYGDVAGDEIAAGELSSIHDVNIRGFKDDGIQAEGGLGGGLELRNILVNFCGGYGLNLGAASRNTFTYNGFNATNIRINGCTSGGIHVHDLAKTNGHSNGALVFNSIYFEMRPNTAFLASVGASSEDDHKYSLTHGGAVMQEGFIFTDCDDTPVVINGVQHGARTSDIYDATLPTDTVLMTPHAWGPKAAIRIQSSSRTNTKVPNLTWNGVNLRRTTQQDQGRWAPGFTLIDTSRGWDTAPWSNGSDELGTDPISLEVNLTANDPCEMTIDIAAAAALSVGITLDANDPFTSVAGSKTITIAHTGHSFGAVGAKGCILIGAFSDMGSSGLTNTDINGTSFILTVTSANAYTIELAVAATGSDSFGDNAGVGSAVLAVGSDGNSLANDDLITITGLDDIQGHNPNGTWMIKRMTGSKAIVHTPFDNSGGTTASGGGDMGEIYWTLDASSDANCVRFVDQETHTGTYGKNGKVAHVTDRSTNSQKYMFGNSEYRGQYTTNDSGRSNVSPSPDVFISGVRPGVSLYQSDADPDKKHWSILAQNQCLEINTVDDEGVQSTTPPLALTYEGGLTVASVAGGVTTATAADATPSVLNTRILKVPQQGSNPFDITALDDGVVGQVLIIIETATSNFNRIENSAGTMVLSADWTGNTAGDTLTLVWDGTNWNEIGRSENT